MPERTPNHSPTALGKGRIHPFTTLPISIPKTGKLSTAQEIKSFVRKILLTSPDFPRLYADVVIASAPNSFEANILAQNYEKIVAYTERTKRSMSNLKSCTHIKVTGVRCGSPTLRGEQFCYFHQRMLRDVRRPASRIRLSALLEDEESIQVALMETVNALVRGTIEVKRAELILRALNTAVRNIRRVKFGLNTDDMVREIPDYPTPPLEQVDEEYAAALRREQARAEAASRPRPTVEEVASQHDAMIAHYFGGADKVPANLRRRTPPASPNAPAPTPPPAPTSVATDASAPPQDRVATDAFVRPQNKEKPAPTQSHVGTPAPVRPAGPELPGRSAPPPKPTPTPAAEVTAGKPSEMSTRKPPASVKEVPGDKTKAVASAKRETSRATAPKERKIAAHRASGG